MPGLVNAVYGTIGWLSDPSDYRFIPNFHEFLKMVAYKGAQTDSYKQSPETYWNAAKAYVALALLTDEKVPNYRKLYSGFYMPPKEELPLVQRDAEIIALGLKFEGCDSGFSTSPYMPKEARTAINHHIERLRENWYGKKIKRKENK